ncbi:hypothetical protein SAMN04488005_1265 [Yoonia tamlensis]|uniref:Uncharacterized protein n=1 Tax=Yoonia tamlensis TaxID=390270 RepID=A0A1I6G926_9RHOB|nr:hypothetical protein [Yoonia tamlensis]SFR38678.1 hypothetical protein SAMN04488005_1265 [Yoonia tamlensis]
MAHDIIITHITKSPPQSTPAHTVIGYQVGTRRFMLTLAGHDQIDEGDLAGALAIAEERLKHCVQHGVSNFDNGMVYADDVREYVEVRLRELGLLDADDIDADIAKSLDQTGSQSVATHPDDQPSLEDLAKIKAQNLIDRVVASGDYLSEAGYLARILYHLDVVQNDFLVGALWSEMNWFLNHERSALYGEKFLKPVNTAPATIARQRRAQEDAREVVAIAKRIDRGTYLTLSGRIKIRPLAKAVKEELDRGATQRSCGLRKIEMILRKGLS